MCPVLESAESLANQGKSAYGSFPVAAPVARIQRPHTPERAEGWIPAMNAGMTHARAGPPQATRGSTRVWNSSIERISLAWGMSVLWVQPKIQSTGSFLRSASRLRVTVSSVPTSA